MRPCVSIRGSVRPSVGWLVGGLSCVFSNHGNWQIRQISHCNSILVPSSRRILVQTNLFIVSFLRNTWWTDGRADQQMHLASYRVVFRRERERCINFTLVHNPWSWPGFTRHYRGFCYCITDGPTDGRTDQWTARRIKNECTKHSSKKMSYAKISWYFSWWETSGFVQVGRCNQL